MHAVGLCGKVQVNKQAPAPVASSTGIGNSIGNSIGNDIRFRIGNGNSIGKGNSVGNDNSIGNAIGNGIRIRTVGLLDLAEGAATSDPLVVIFVIELSEISCV